MLFSDYENLSRVNEEGKYSIISHRDQFCGNFPNFKFDNKVLTVHIYRIIYRFAKISSVSKKHSSGKQTVLTNHVLAEVHQHLHVRQVNTNIT